jgi:hypothetical protein
LPLPRLKTKNLYHAAVIEAQPVPVLVDVRLGSFTTDAFTTRAGQCPLLLR